MGSFCLYGGEGGIRTRVALARLNRFRVEIINQQLSFNQTVAPFSPLDSYSGIPPVTDVLCSGLLRFLYAVTPAVIARNTVTKQSPCNAQLSQMALNIHAPVQDTHDIDTAFHNEIKDQVLAGRVNAQPLVQFIPTLPQFRVTCQFRTDISQAVYVVPGLLHAPGRNGVIPDRVDIGSRLRPQPDFSHASARLPWRLHRHQSQKVRPVRCRFLPGWLFAVRPV